MFDGHWRTNIEAGLRPIGTSLRRTGLSADHLTATGIAMAIAAAVAIGAGHFRLGLVLLTLTGICDFLDGALAKAAGITNSRRGAFFDSVTDRLTDALLFGGVAWYFAANRPGLLVMLPMALLGAASLVSYQRAKAESLGFDARGGLMERAERFIVLGFGLLFFEVLVGVLWVMLALTAITAVQRFVKVWRQAERPEPMPLPERRARTRYRRRAARPLSQNWRERTRNRR
ncbi:MAG: CDP-alcohol phosphatidyltransferase family protein [Acidimicrobiales bacterium]|nr:CDP-alcohol phosphatidyltransferase family protein [Acidimicrobiales bacterium]